MNVPFKSVLKMLLIVLVAMLPIDARALMTIERGREAPRSSQHAMGTRPMPQKGLPGSRPAGAVPAALKKLEMRTIRQPLAASGLDAGVTRLAEQIFKGATVGAARTLEAPPHNGSSRSFQAVIRHSRSDEAGNRHVRVGQTYRGLPVIGAEVIVHVNRDDMVYRVTGTYLPDADLSVTPAISAQAALDLGMQALQHEKNVRVQQQPALVVYGQSLAYHFTIAHDGPTPGRWQYYVDAHSGKLISRYNDIKFAEPSGEGAHASVSGERLAGEDGLEVTFEGWHDTTHSAYYLYHLEERWGVYDAAVDDWELQDTNAWGQADRAAISCAYNLSLVQAYVSEHLGFSSFDDEAGLARANVHYDQNFSNAFWDGIEFSFGDGDGVAANPLTVLDIVAHEFGHALTQYSSDLLYLGESGALNESYSDIFAALVEFAKQGDGRASYPQSVPGASDWLLGEDSWLSGPGMRNLRDPLAYDYPARYHGTHYSYGWWDNRGVHVNSSVLNKAFYLLAEGGTGENDGLPFQVTGIGIEDAGRVAMQANLYYHGPTDGFLAAGQAWLDAAADLALDTAQVAAAFDAVGVTATVYVQEQATAETSDRLAAQDFERAYNSYDVFLADDFTLDRPRAIRKIFIDGFLDTAVSLFDAQKVSFLIYPDSGGRPAGTPEVGSGYYWNLSAALTNSQITITLDADQASYSDLLLTLDTPIVLPAGRFWLVFYPRLDAGSHGQYYRATAASGNGLPAQVLNPGGGMDLPPDWTPITAASTFGTRDQDLAFTIVADEIDPSHHIVIFTADANGSISGRMTQSVPPGGSCQSVRAVPRAGYRFANWTGSGGFTSTENPLLLTDVTGDRQITANFKPGSAGVSTPDRSSDGGGGCFIDSL